MRRSSVLACATMMIVVAARDARADDPPAPPVRDSYWQRLRGGHDLVASAPTAVVFDGMWSVYGQIGTELTNRAWDAPYPWGTLGHYATHILYGTTWTVMLAVESLVVLAAAGGTFEWIAEANYRTDWMIATDAPACPHAGAYGGCGMGVGDMAFISIRPQKSKWWFEAGGGWIQQRIYNDEFRTVAESSWLLTPFAAAYEIVNTDPERAASLRVIAGPGLTLGLHNGHMHETLRGEREKNLHAPWHSMYLIDGGVGPSARIEARATFARRIGLEGEVVIAPFLLGGTTSERPSSDIAPLDFERDGMPVWRRATFGISWNDRAWPVRPVLGVWGAELSERPIGLYGHRGVILRFDIPLRVPGGT